MKHAAVGRRPPVERGAVSPVYELRAAKAANDTGLAKSALKSLVEGFPQSADADALSAELAQLGE